MKRMKKRTLIFPLIGLMCLIASITVYAAMGGRAEQVKNRFEVKKCHDYRIHFDANRQKYGVNFCGETEDQVAAYDETVALTKNGYSYPGAQFLYWTLESDPKEVDIKLYDRQEVINLAPENSDEVTLYAQWENVPIPLEQGYYSVELQGGSGGDGAFYHKDDDEDSFVDETFPGYSGENFSGLIYVEKGTVVTVSTEEKGESGATYRCIGTREEDGKIAVQEWFE